MKTETLRQELMAKGLVSADLRADPISQFEQWYAQTMETDLAEPNAMSLATVDAHGQPWQRMVLLKLFDEQGFVFFTNYSSRKAEHIAGNNRVSLLFPWQALGRQVKVTGCTSSTRQVAAGAPVRRCCRRTGSRVRRSRSRPRRRSITR